MATTHNMTPEERARVHIDKMFADSGWKVVDRDQYEAGQQAAAIREGLLKGNKEADYLLFVDGMAVGVLEAKKVSVDVASDSVCDQAATYTRSVPNTYRTFLPNRKLAFAYTSNGNDLFFLDMREKDPEPVRIDHIHTPYEIIEMLGKDKFGFSAGLPTLRQETKGFKLRKCQYEAITNLEKSFNEGQSRALISLATGAGKTFTACLAAYRFLAYTPMKRVLFLVDRNNLAKQAETEFGTFKMTDSGQPFNQIYVVDRLKSSKISNASSVVISTINRVFSLLSGTAIMDNDNDDEDFDENKKVVLPDNPLLPPDYFDLIFIDECHRSIYGNWKCVIEYFKSAKIVGLTATPIPQTLAFFNGNIVVNYTLDQSVADGVNVPDRTFRIKTEETENGGAINVDDRLKKETKYDGKVKDVVCTASKFYTKEDLNRTIVNPAQIKLILETYKERVYKDMYPHRKPIMAYIPKTLIFALNESHADNIVQIAREVFADEVRDNEAFIQKITYSINDSNGKIQEFRTSIEFRIAVTCTLVATGTDVKPLEVVMFMRDVRSEPLYIQMKGRGTRTIDDNALRSVTPNADSKDCYMLVDARGVTESEKTVPVPGQPDDDVEHISLEVLLERLTHGNLQDEYLQKISGVLGRLNNKCERAGEHEELDEFTRIAGISMHDLSSSIVEALQSGSLPPYVSINEPNTERMALVSALTFNADARRCLLKIAAGFQTTNLDGTDTLIYAGFSQEDASVTVSAFEAYCAEHKDEIEALRIIYNHNEDVPITYAMLKDLEKKLREANSEFLPIRLWDSYAVVRSADVRRNEGREEQEALTNLIQLVRFAYKQIDTLTGIYPQANRLFNLWYGRKQQDVSDAQVSIMKQLVTYIASNGSCSVDDIKQMDMSKAVQLITAYTNKIKAEEALTDLAKFVLNKVA